MSGMEQRAGQTLANQGNKLENRAQTGSANNGPNPTTGNQGGYGQQGSQQGGQQGGQQGYGGNQQYGSGVTGNVPQGGQGGGQMQQQGGGMQGGGFGGNARGPQGGMQQGGGGGGGVSGSYETHRHKDDLDEKGSYQSN